MFSDGRVGLEEDAARGAGADGETEEPLERGGLKATQVSVNQAVVIEVEREEKAFVPFSKAAVGEAVEMEVELYGGGCTTT
ncbi:hypothetical protein Vadar_026390 [Vaccinium darrowii]|uniref:Uncharacterized protein n=1 Tax=Vaccinium darrowii TaxID=229202 RepID=A0ACB7X4Q9_9ERIC|nr:hypothetical protein Vadar_026390 [Vaccinium darrowii]